MVHKRPYDRSVDVWSVGILCFEFLTGNPPFESETNEATYEKIRNLNVQYPSYMSPEARNFISEILKPSSSERPSIEQILKHPWLN